MASSERGAWVLAVLLLGCVPKERPLAPDEDREQTESPSTETTDASVPDARTPEDAAKREDATVDAETIVPEDAYVPSVPDASDEVVDAGIVAPDARVEVTPSVRWCGVDEVGCKDFDFEREVDDEGYFGPFWCHPYGDCRTRVALTPEGASNHVWTSKVAGEGDAKALGVGMNVHMWRRTAYRRAQIDFDVWPVSVRNEDAAVWFSLQRIDPDNRGHALLSLYSTQEGTFAILGPTFAPERTERFASSPPPGAPVHVHIELERVDDDRSVASVRIGDETLSLSLIPMPLFDSSGAAAYDVLLGLFDSQRQTAIGAATATAQYDNFVLRTTFPP